MVSLYGHAGPMAKLAGSLNKSRFALDFPLLRYLEHPRALAKPLNKEIDTFWKPRIILA